MTVCLSESQLELLVLSLEQDPSTQLPPHLDSCNFCASKYEDILDFYAVLSDEFKTIDQLSRTDVVLHKRQLESTEKYQFSAINLVQMERPIPVYSKTLAADSELSAIAPAVHNIGVYTSNDEQLMVRILKAADGSYSLFLLADSEALYQNVLVKIVGFEFDYVSDKNGVVRLGTIDLPEPDKLGIEVRCAAQSYDLKNYLPEVGSLVGEGQISMAHNDNRHIQMEIISIKDKFMLKINCSEILQSNGQDTIRVVVIKNDIHTEVQSIVEGVALFEDIKDPSSLQIKIFA